MKVNKINLFSIWLISLMICVAIIILIGGYTRISDSGLSITEWKPITGVLFPLSQSAWTLEFEKYKLIDEFKLINSLMTLNEFKFIYFWEWFHRFFARFIGIVFTIPLIYLVYKKLITKSDLPYIFTIGLLGMMQAVIGWYMVKSGLVDRVDVSQYRLSFHLITAFLILGVTLRFFVKKYILSNAVIISKEEKNEAKFFFLLLVLTFFQIFYGAYVSGTHSGLLYDTWPSYNENIIPVNIFGKDSLIANFFENGDFIIFFHRTFALVLTLVLLIINYRVFTKSFLYGYKKIILILDILFLIQILLGIFMTYLNIPWYLALLHQGNSIFIFIILAYLHSYINFARATP